MSSVSVTCLAGKVRVTVTAALTVELVHFSAKAEEEQVVLEWQTASEANNRGFEIQRSKDGLNWHEIGLVAGHGATTEVHDYAF